MADRQSGPVLALAGLLVAALACAGVSAALSQPDPCRAAAAVDPAVPSQCRSLDDLLTWLARDENRPLRSYRAVAAALGRAGVADAALDVLYAGAERDRLRSTGFGFAWKTALHATVGHGYRLHRLINWIVAFVVLGAAVLWLSGEGARHRMGLGRTLGYSAGNLLFPVPLGRRWQGRCSGGGPVRLQGQARWYFRFHRLMGVLLLVCLAVGILRRFG